MASRKKAGVAIPISNEIDLKLKKVMKDKNGYFIMIIMIKWTIYQENITLTNIHALNKGAPKYIEQLLTELKEESDKNTIIVRDLIQHSQL